MSHKDDDRFSEDRKINGWERAVLGPTRTRVKQYVWSMRYVVSRLKGSFSLTIFSCFSSDRINLVDYGSTIGQILLKFY